MTRIAFTDALELIDRLCPRLDNEPVAVAGALGRVQGSDVTATAD